jgi:hypothetical protein
VCEVLRTGSLGNFDLTPGQHPGGGFLCQARLPEPRKRCTACG